MATDILNLVQPKQNFSIFFKAKCIQNISLSLFSISVSDTTIILDIQVKNWEIILKFSFPPISWYQQLTQSPECIQNLFITSAATVIAVVYTTLLFKA